MVSRIERLKRISQCPIIYIGGAGTQPGSRNTLKGRYTEFSGRHTAMYPIWILLYFGWKLQFGWKKTKQPENEEGEYKKKYRKAHQGKLPALVKQQFLTLTVYACMQIGDTFEIDYDDTLTPEGVCIGAFAAILPYVTVLSCDGEFPWEKETKTKTTIHCPDPEGIVLEIEKSETS